MSNKTDMIKEVAEKAGVSVGKARKVLREVLQYIMENLPKKNKILLKGFGYFYIQKRSARQGRNPRTHQPIQVAPRLIPKFRAGRVFKKLVRK